jgi:hypothetical protein
MANGPGAGDPGGEPLGVGAGDATVGDACAVGEGSAEPTTEGVGTGLVMGALPDGAGVASDGDETAPRTAPVGAGADAVAEPIAASATMRTPNAVTGRVSLGTDDAGTPGCDGPARRSGPERDHVGW